MDIKKQGEAFNDMREAGQKKREKNRQTSPELLRQKGIQFEEKNEGAHLIVKGRDCLIDFWPGTGKFIARNGSRGRGVFNIMKLCI